MILVSRILMLVIIIVLLLFCMSNLDSVTVKLLGWESQQMPLFLILLFVFFFGFFLALFWQALRNVTVKKKVDQVPVMVPEPKIKKKKEKRSWSLKKTAIDKQEKNDRQQDIVEPTVSTDKTLEEDRSAEPTAATDSENKQPE